MCFLRFTSSLAQWIVSENYVPGDGKVNPKSKRQWNVGRKTYWDGKTVAEPAFVLHGFTQHFSSSTISYHYR